MVVLDTNVISELVRPQPSQAVIDFLDAYESSELVVTAVTAAEPRAGVVLLSAGRRQREIGVCVESLLTDTFAGYMSCSTSNHPRTMRASSDPYPDWSAALDAQIAAIS